MAASPANIIRRMNGTNAVIDGKASVKEIKRAFINAGYGMNKAMKWIDLYLREGVFEEVGRDENGIMYFRSDWWLI